MLVGLKTADGQIQPHKLRDKGLAGSAYTMYDSNGIPTL